MGKTLSSWVQMLRNMGVLYILFRVQYAFQRHMGLLRVRFPRRSTVNLSPLALKQRARDAGQFFQPRVSCSHLFHPKSCVLTAEEMEDLKWRVSRISDKEYTYFGGRRFSVHDWHTHPLTGYQYPANQHWSEVPQFSVATGDIKFIWEKGRFTFLYDLIRYEQHSGMDQFSVVVGHIVDWIDRNPVNSGPHWVCSQELSLRVLNWIFAIKYYEKRLSDDLQHKIFQSLGDQMEHVWENRSFASTCVRNNHVLTEALALYSTGLLFSFFSKSKIWEEYGKSSFEREILYQIQSDGSYIQHSMNYHRVLVQLLTWALRLGEVNGAPFSKKIYQKAELTLEFMLALQDPVSGHFPHYGPQDGVLFFPLSQADFRDYRPQLASLAGVLGVITQYHPGCWQEDSEWWGMGAGKVALSPSPQVSVYNYSKGGYFMLKDGDTGTFVRCASYSSRPFQADNLHMDLWVEGQNMLKDAGTCHYLSVDEVCSYFSGTAAHNTVQLGTHDQMLRGPRFMWNYWIKESAGKWRYDRGSQSHIFYGYFVGFMQFKRRIVHRRMITKPLGKRQWLVEDWVEGVPESLEMRQIWHPGTGYAADWSMLATDADGEVLEARHEPGWYASNYGSREPALQVVFSTQARYLKTHIFWY